MGQRYKLHNPTLQIVQNIIVDTLSLQGIVMKIYIVIFPGIL